MGNQGDDQDDEYERLKPLSADVSLTEFVKGFMGVDPDEVKGEEGKPENGEDV